MVEKNDKKLIKFSILAICYCNVHFRRNYNDSDDVKLSEIGLRWISTSK